MGNYEQENKYIHLGEDVAVLSKDIIGVFDLDSVNMASRASMDFLHKAEESGEITFIGKEIPRSFVVTGTKGVFMCALSAATIINRIENNEV